MSIKRKIYKVAALLMILAAFPAKSQIVNIAAGVDEFGVTSYIQAFEYDYVTEKPSFPGGEKKLMEFINENRRYPEEAYKRNIQGRVTCWFIVNADGSISQVNICRSVNPYLNEEAIRIFSLMPDWIPGRLDGVAVPVRVMRSVRFKK